MKSSQQNKVNSFKDNIRLIIRILFELKRWIINHQNIIMFLTLQIFIIEN